MLLSGLLISGKATSGDIKSQMSTHSLNEGIALTTKQIELLETQALNGSGKAAIRLANYYVMIVNDLNKQAYWARIAAENDDPNGWYYYGFILSDSKDANDKVRAHYWLVKAAKAGVEEARKVLKKGK
jgi:TPR repeat protein